MSRPSSCTRKYRSCYARSRCHNPAPGGPPRATPKHCKARSLTKVPLRMRHFKPFPRGWPPKGSPRRQCRLAAQAFTDGTTHSCAGEQHLVAPAGDDPGHHPRLHRGHHRHSIREFRCPDEKGTISPTKRRLSPRRNGIPRAVEMVSFARIIPLIGIMGIIGQSILGGVQGTWPPLGSLGARATEGGREHPRPACRKGNLANVEETCARADQKSPPQRTIP